MIEKASDQTLLLILGNQLFPPDELLKTRCRRIFMAEDLGLCREHRHHKLKILMFFTAMRAYRDELRMLGYQVFYRSIDDDDFTQDYTAKLASVLAAENINRVAYFEIEDHFFAAKIDQFLAAGEYLHQQHSSPMFLCSRDKFAAFAEGKKALRMASFYQLMRTDLAILLDGDGKPVGGRWSFDEDNRKKLPKDIVLPSLPPPTESANGALKLQIEQHFADHPGSMENLWMPTTRGQALAWLEHFLAVKFVQFGTYEDAMHSGDQFLFHSALSPLMNMGLLTPREVVDRALAYADEQAVPINSVEGFIRQIIGWREFIRGVYHSHGDTQARSNFWGHDNRLTDHWYLGTTGIPPLDDAIIACRDDGYTHHIPRLMVIANLMTLSRIHPDEIYRWFMEMFVDSSDWVMVPNVYGMGSFADGGLFATKPYLCGSNYLLKMSNYKKGPWCDVVDGLYWRFMQDNLEFFKSNPRLSIMPRALSKLNPERKSMIFACAETFTHTMTAAAAG